MIEVSTTPRLAIVTLAGEFDLATAAALDAVLTTAVSGDWRLVVIDLAAVSFVDLAGADPMVRAHDSASRAGKELVILHPRPRVSRVLVHCGLAAALVSPAERGSTGIPQPPSSVERRGDDLRADAESGGLLRKL